MGQPAKSLCGLFMYQAFATLLGILIKNNETITYYVVYPVNLYWLLCVSKSLFALELTTASILQEVKKEQILGMVAHICASTLRN